MPVERTHGKMIAFSVPASEPVLKILKRIEFLRYIEILVVVPVTAFHFTIMRRGQFMTNAELI